MYDVIKTYNLFLSVVRNRGIGISEILDILKISYNNGHFLTPSFFSKYFHKEFIIEFSNLNFEEFNRTCENLTHNISKIELSLKDYTPLLPEDLLHDEDPENVALVFELLSKENIELFFEETKQFINSEISGREEIPKDEIDGENSNIEKILFNIPVSKFAALLRVMYETKIVEGKEKTVFEDINQTEFVQKAIKVFRNSNKPNLSFNNFYNNFTGPDPVELEEIGELLDRMRTKSIHLSRKKPS